MIANANWKRTKRKIERVTKRLEATVHDMISPDSTGTEQSRYLKWDQEVSDF
jgi:hypothetical protein